MLSEFVYNASVTYVFIAGFMAVTYLGYETWKKIQAYILLRQFKAFQKRIDEDR